MKSLVAVLIGFPLVFAANVEAKSNQVQKKTITNDQGYTLELKRQKQSNEQGDVRARRGFQITDADGNLVKKGRDRGRNSADGKKARAQQRVTFDENGNKIEKRRRARIDGEGNQQYQRGKKVTDENGNLIGRGRDRSYNRADGSKYREQQRQYINANGQKVSKRRVKIKR